MTKKRKRNKPRLLPLVGLLACAAVIAGVVMAALGSGGEDVDVTAQGIAYLEALEQKDPNTVDQVLRQRRLAELEAQREELLRQVRSGEKDPFTMFQDAVILGDSRAVGFFYYGYVDESRDLTGSGDTILNIKSKLDTLEAMNPKYVYLTYGLNDIKIGYWASVQSHINDYMDCVSQIRQRLPDAVIVISSVLPYVDQTPEDLPESTAEPTQPASGTTSGLSADDLRRLGYIPEWNEVMKQTCAEFGVVFVDNSTICAEHEDLWEPDGIHVKKSFYPYWGKNLVVAALAEGGITDENADA